VERWGVVLKKRASPKMSSEVSGVSPAEGKRGGGRFTALKKDGKYYVDEFFRQGGEEKERKGPDEEEACPLSLPCLRAGREKERRGGCLCIERKRLREVSDKVEGKEKGGGRSGLLQGKGR